MTRIRPAYEIGALYPEAKEAIARARTARIARRHKRVIAAEFLRKLAKSLDNVEGHTLEFKQGETVIDVPGLLREVADDMVDDDA